MINNCVLPRLTMLANWLIEERAAKDEQCAAASEAAWWEDGARRHVWWAAGIRQGADRAATQADSILSGLWVVARTWWSCRARAQWDGAARHTRLPGQSAEGSLSSAGGAIPDPCTCLNWSLRAEQACHRRELPGRILWARLRRRQGREEATAKGREDRRDFRKALEMRYIQATWKCSMTLVFHPTLERKADDVAL